MNESSDKEEQESRSKNAVISKFLNIALIEKYDITVGLLSRLLWPLTLLILMAVFQQNISFLLDQLSKSLYRTSRIKIAGVEIEVYAESIRGSDVEINSLIENLNRDELLFILGRGEIPFQVDSSDLLPEDMELIEDLQGRGLVAVEYLPETDDYAAQTVIKLTDLGIRVYKELQNIVINFIEGLPSVNEP